MLPHSLICSLIFSSFCSISGIVSEFIQNYTKVKSYGLCNCPINMIDDVKAGKKVFESYYCNVPNGEAVQVGQKVRLTGPIMKYNTTAEMKNGNVEIIEEAE